MSQPHSALEGIKIIDLSRVLGGPYCTQILADHGADVLKIEPPQGDETRGWGPPFDAHGAASYFLGVNRNKRGMTLDLNDAAQREQLLKLLENADVLVENFKTGSMEKWGMGFDVLHDRFPRLIHCRVSGFGADGPLGGLPGYDAAIQAMSGLMSVNGEYGGEPLRIGVPIVDIATGMNAAMGVLLALHERSRPVRGIQFVRQCVGALASAQQQLSTRWTCAWSQWQCASEHRALRHICHRNSTDFSGRGQRQPIC
jgi:crotonobetainyl-CoA:carnitine CoA-transferase CaiB-like acyl-CoA transferase